MPLAPPTPVTPPADASVDVEALDAWSRVDSLDAAIARCRSATAALEAWCRERAGASGETLRVRRLDGPVVSATPEQHERLAVRPEEPIAYRRVEILFGPHVLSVASNWYVPGRLTGAMNRALGASDSPFGRVVADLAPSRRTLAARRLWGPDAAQPIPVILFEHRALLFTRDGLPFAEVDEHYTRGILGVGARAPAVPLPRPSRLSDP